MPAWSRTQRPATPAYGVRPIARAAAGSASTRCDHPRTPSPVTCPRGSTARGLAALDGGGVRPGVPPTPSRRVVIGAPMDPAARVGAHARADSKRAAARASPTVYSILIFIRILMSWFPADPVQPMAGRGG